MDIRPSNSSDFLVFPISVPNLLVRCPKQQMIQVVRTNQIPRMIPQTPWYVDPKVSKVCLWSLSTFLVESVALSLLASVLHLKRRFVVRYVIVLVM